MRIRVRPLAFADVSKLVSGAESSEQRPKTPAHGTPRSTSKVLQVRASALATGLIVLRDGSLPVTFTATDIQRHVLGEDLLLASEELPLARVQQASPA